MEEISELEDKYNIKYIGFQTVATGESYFMFNDLLTKSTFMVIDLNDIKNRLKDIRNEFKKE